ncbi:MAG: hypothetical protein ACR5LF_00190 [Symbiopectobacterium sp.]
MTITVQKSNIVTITHRLVNITILERITAIVIHCLIGILALLSIPTIFCTRHSKVIVVNLLMILVTRGL